MNLLKTFESRVSDAFGATPQGYASPISLRKLAKKTAREMEDQTLNIDGVEIAPALYTIFVSLKDDEVMRPIYSSIANEISGFVEAQAKTLGYRFVAKPFARFMVDPHLRSGKFLVSAENINVDALERIRNEEDDFFGEGVVVKKVGAAFEQEEANSFEADSFTDDAPLAAPGGYNPLDVKPQSLDIDFDAPKSSMRPHPVFDEPEQTPVFEQNEVVSGDQNLTPEPLDAQDVQNASYDEVEEPDLLGESSVMRAEEVQEEEDLEEVAASMTFEDPKNIEDSFARMQAMVNPNAAPIAFESPQIAEESVVASQADSFAPRPETEPRFTPEVIPDSARRSSTTQCQLKNVRTGNVFIANAPMAIVGREKRSADIVLQDPNVSRRHAELSYDGRYWRITDLGSTNGTTVNGADVDTYVLRSGDRIVVGLTTLEFREI